MATLSSYARTQARFTQKKTEYGMQSVCKHCGQDIEFHGRARGWTDRGGNRACVTYYDKKKGEYVKPKTKHARG